MSYPPHRKLAKGEWVSRRCRLSRSQSMRQLPSTTVLSGRKARDLYQLPYTGWAASRCATRISQSLGTAAVLNRVSARPASRRDCACSQAQLRAAVFSRVIQQRCGSEDLQQLHHLSSGSIESFSVTRWVVGWICPRCIDIQNGAVGPLLLLQLSLEGTKTG